MELQRDISLSEYTTFGIGGAAEYFVSVNTETELHEALEYARAQHLPWHIIAGGSNILVADKGVEGLVIHIAMNDSHHEGTQLVADAGCVLSDLVMDSAQRGLGGWESLYGIPGTIGGAVRGNAGAFGTEMCDVITSVDVLNTETGDVRAFSHGECDFGYRTSFFKMHPEWIVLSAAVALAATDADAAVAKAEEILAERNARQIQNIQSGGSYFMNPTVAKDIQDVFREDKHVEAKEGRVPAGWLIEKSGFKASCEGAACTGERSANYVINTGGASAADVHTLATNIKNAVRTTWGVELQEEVTQLGFL